MRLLALLVALLGVVVGLVGVFTPDSLVTVGRYVATPVGLYAIGAFRVGVGLVLILVAASSRAPRTVRAFGVVVLVAGLATPLLGVERAQAMLDWEATRGTTLIRVGAAIALAMGGFLAFAVATRHRPA